MLTWIAIVGFVLFQDVVPFKPGDEFEVTLDYHFRPRPLSDRNTVDLSRRTDRGSGVLPYLKLHIAVKQAPANKGRVAITDNLNPRPLFKRIAPGSILELDLGFTADMIDRVRPYEYTLTFVDAERTPIDRIVILVDQDGSFFVNGEKRGRF